MAGKNQVNVTFAGDSKQLEQAFDRVGQASREMADQVGASARETAQGVSGAAESLDRFGEAADNVDTRAMGFRDTLTGLQDSMASTSALASGDFFQALLLAGFGIGDLASGIYNFAAPALKNLVEKMGAAKLAMSGLGIAAGVAVIGFLVWQSQTRKLGDDIGDLAEDLKRLVDTGQKTVLLRRAFDESRSAMHDFRGELGIASDGFKSFLQDVNTLGGQLGERAIDKFTALDTAMAQLVDQGADANEVFSSLATAYQLTGEEAERLRTLLPQYTESAQRAKERTHEMAEEHRANSKAIKDHVNSLQDLTDTIRKQTDPIFAYIDAQNSVRDAQNAVSEAQKEFGARSPEYRDAVFALAQAQLELVDATASVKDATDASLIPALKRLRNDGHLSEQSFQAVVAAINETKAAADRLDNSRIRLRLDVMQRGDIPWGSRIPEFHSGGRVPGAPGTEMLAMLQAGEQVLTPAQQAHGSGRGVTADTLRMASASGLDRVFLTWLEGALRANNLQLVRL